MRFKKIIKYIKLESNRLNNSKSIRWNDKRDKVVIVN